MYLYLAGALTHHHKNNEFHKAVVWRNQIAGWSVDNHIKYFDPSITYLKEINHTYNSKMCVAQNKYFLNECNILIVDLNHIMESPGTQWEMCYATEKGMPIIAFGEPSWSPHIMYGISHLCKDIDEVIELLTNMFIQ